MKKLLLISLGLLVSSQAMAVTGSVGESFGLIDAESIVIAVLLIALCVALGLFIYKKYRNTKLQIRSGIRVLESMSLSKHETIYLLEVDNRRVLMASSDGKLSKIHAYEKDELCEIQPLEKVSTQAHSEHVEIGNINKFSKQGITAH